MVETPKAQARLEKLFLPFPVRPVTVRFKAFRLFWPTMTPEISEFSYGFALTNEIVGWTPLKAAPIFPSLIEEDRKGGGYDVKLDLPGVPLYLQFKRSDCMLRKSAAEIKDQRLNLSVPFYRFKITESGKSDQHKMLLDLDNGANKVFYAAPKFHEIAEINGAWLRNEVASRSIFMKPSHIGILDTQSHHVAYGKTQAFLCSAPKSIGFLEAVQLSEVLRGSLKENPGPLRERLPELIESVMQVLRRSDRRGRQRGGGGEQSIPSIMSAPFAAADQDEPSLGVPTRPLRTPFKTCDTKLVSISTNMQGL